MKLRGALLLLAAFGGVASPGPAEPLACTSLPILCYHRILPQPETEYDLSVTDFCAQMDFLQREGFTTLTLRQWVEVLEEKAALPPRPVILTFDDGSLSAYQAVFPILRAHRFRGTFFISTALVSDPSGEHVTWPHLREMAEAGMEIMPHGHSHVNLAKRDPDESWAAYCARVRKELVRSRSLLETSLRRSCPFLAYPYGAYDREVERMAVESGFTLILTACPGTNSARTNQYRLKRQLIYQHDGMEVFRRKLSALPHTAGFPFPEGAILDQSPNRIDIDLPRLEPGWGSVMLLLDRKEVEAAYDPTASRITFLPTSPLRAGLHILEVRIIQEGSGCWRQDSTLFAIRPPRRGEDTKEQACGSSS